jgi:hypothetical protein
MALLAVLLATVLVVAAGRGRLLPGDPTAVPVPAAPRVGDCLHENPYAQGADLYRETAPLAVLRSGPCSGPRPGEVVAMTDGPPDGSDVPVAAHRQCLKQAFRYLGLPTPPPPELPVGPAVSVGYVLVGPDDRQRAAGQSWAACVVFLPISIDAVTPATIDHTVRDAWNRPEDSRLFAQCLDQVGLVAANCWWPHRFEVISRRLGDPAATHASVQEACTQDAVQALGSPTALNRGELSVLAIPARPDPTGDGLGTGAGAVTPGVDYVTNCLLSPSNNSKTLTASVRGLRDAPVPFA